MSEEIQDTQLESEQTEEAGESKEAVAQPEELNDLEVEEEGIQEADSEAKFIDHVSEMVKCGYTVIGLSLGVELGLFEALAKIERPVTPDELAKLTSCKRRYISEWLNSMVMSNIINVDESGRTFILPQHHRKGLTSKDGYMYDLDVTLPHIFPEYKDTIRSFKSEDAESDSSDSDEEEDPEDYIPLTSVPNQCTDEQAVEDSANYVKKDEHGLAERMKLGINVCQFGTGTDLLLSLAAEFPNSSFVGFDQNECNVRLVKQAARYKDVPNIECLLSDLSSHLDSFRDNFDLALVLDSIQYIKNPGKCLQAISRSMKPGGQLFLFEAYVYSNPYLTEKDAKMKVVAQRRYIHSLCHSLQTALVGHGSRPLGACPGVESLSMLLKRFGFIVKNAVPLPECHLVALVCAKPDKK